MAWASKFNKLSSSSPDLDLGADVALSAKKFGELIYSILENSSNNKVINVTFNNDSGQDYTRSYGVNGNTDNPEINKTKFDLTYTGWGDKLHVMNFCNIDGEEKLIIHHVVETDHTEGTNADAEPHRIELVGKYTDTTTGQVTRIDCNKGNQNDYTADDLAIVILTDS